MLVVLLPAQATDGIQSVGGCVSVQLPHSQRRFRTNTLIDRIMTWSIGELGINHLAIIANGTSETGLLTRCGSSSL
jgi:hypothetical protein